MKSTEAVKVNNRSFQGDLGIKRLELHEKPVGNWLKTPRHLVAKSQNGHHHYVVSESPLEVLERGPVTFVMSEAPIRIEHAGDHNPQEYEAGLLRFDRQREYLSPDEERTVSD